MPNIPIRPYEQQTVPNGQPGITNIPAIGEASARAVGEFGRAAGQFANVMEHRADQKAQLQAEAQLKDMQLAAEQKLQDTVNSLPADADPSGLTDHFDGWLTDQRNEAMKGATDPLLRKHMEAGAQRLQGQYQLKAQEYEAAAVGRFDKNNAVAVLDTSKKLVALDPGHLDDEIASARSFIDKLRIPPDAKQELFNQQRSELAATAVGRMVTENPYEVLSRLNNPDDSLTVNLKPSDLERAKDVAKKAWSSTSAATAAERIADGASSLMDVQKWIDSVKKAGETPDVYPPGFSDADKQNYVDLVEKMAQGQYLQKRQAVNELQQQVDKAGWQSVAEGRMPAQVDANGNAITASEYVRMADYFKARASGAKNTTDLDTYRTLYTMMQFHPEQFANESLVKYANNLSREDMKMFEKEQVNVRNGRTTLNDRVKGQIDISLKSMGFDDSKAKTPQQKAAMAVDRDNYRAGILSYVSQREEELGRKMTDKEVDSTIREYVSYTHTNDSEGGIFTDPPVHTFTRDVPSDYARAMSTTFRIYGMDASPQEVAKQYGELKGKIPDIEQTLRDKGVKVTADNVMRYALESVSGVPADAAPYLVGELSRNNMPAGPESLAPYWKGIVSDDDQLSAALVQMGKAPTLENKIKLYIAANKQKE